MEPKKREDKGKTKNRNRAAQKKWSIVVHGVSPKGGRESMMGRICETSRFLAGSEKVRELWMV